MFKYFAKKLFMKILCALIPSKKGRLALREKFGFGEIFIPLSKSDSFVPCEVLDAMTQKSPLDFFRIHNNIAPPPQYHIIRCEKSLAINIVFYPRVIT